MKREVSRKRQILWLGIVLVLSIGLRVILYKIYPAQTFSDTGGYLRSAQAVLNGFDKYDGTRTPIYPIFIALLGSERAIYIGQLCLGVCISLGWYAIAYKATSRAYFGALIALAHSLNPGQFFFEANLLTETLASFWLMLAFTGAYFWISDKKYHVIWLGVAVGLSSALAALTRPQFIFIPFLLSIFLGFSINGRRINFNWKPIVGILLPALLLIGGWMSWIHARYHIFSVTAMSGFHLVQHTGYYFEDVPDENAVLRDVYLEYRQDRMDAYGTQSNTIWEAIPAMQEATGFNFYELSRKLQEISVQLILSHPLEYLWNVIKGWLFFWRAPIYWNRTAFSIPIARVVMGVWALGARGLMLMMNMAFIGTSLFALVSKRARHRWELTPFNWLLAGCIWGTSILTSLIEHGENQRFLIPLQTAVAFWFIWIVFAMLKEGILKKQDELKGRMKKT